MLPNKAELNQSEILSNIDKFVSNGDTTALLSLASAVASQLNNADTDASNNTASNVTDPAQGRKEKEVKCNDRCHSLLTL